MFWTYVLIALALLAIYWLFIREIRPDVRVPLAFPDFPIFGMFFSAVKRRGTPIEADLETAQRLGEQFYVNLPGILGLSLVVFDPESIKHVYNEPELYILPQLRKELFGDILGDGIFMSNGQNWKVQRTLAHPIFTNQSRADMYPVYQKCVQDLFQVLDESIRSGTPLEIQDMMKRVTLDTFGIIGFGHEIGCVRKPIPFSKAFDWILIETDNRFFDPTRKFWNSSAFSKNQEILFNFVHDLIKARRKEGFEGRTDYLSHLLRMEHEGRCEPLSEKFLRDQLLNFFLAGRDTTAMLLTWTMWLLSLHPEVEARVRAEVETVLHGEPANISTTKELKFMQKVFDESMRLYPPAVAINSKYVARDDILPNGIKVKQGQMVTIPVGALHRLEKYWGPDVLEFNPDRFDKPLQHPYQFIPFQKGSRQCLGMNMAYEEAKVILSMIIQEGYKWKLAPGQPDVTYRMTAILGTKDGVQMNFSKN